MTKSTTVGIHEAKTRLSELLRLVENGHEVVIARNGAPVARLVDATTAPPRRFGQDEGVFAVPDDFDAPLPDDVIGDFYR